MRVSIVTFSVEEAIEMEITIAWFLEKIFSSPKMKKSRLDEKLAADLITYKLIGSETKQKRISITYFGSKGNETAGFAVPDGISIASYLGYICAILETHLKITLINPECKVKATFKDDEKNEKIIVTFNYV